MSPLTIHHPSLNKIQKKKIIVKCIQGKRSNNPWDPVPTFNKVFEYHPIASQIQHSQVATKEKNAFASRRKRSPTLNPGIIYLYLYIYCHDFITAIYYKKYCFLKTAALLMVIVLAFKNICSINKTFLYCCRRLNVPTRT